MEWISVKDRLPEKDGAYLVCHELYNCDIYGVWIIEFFTKPYKGWYQLDEDEEGDYYRPFHGVTYWMPLPKAHPKV